MLERILLADSGTAKTKEMMRYLLEIPALRRSTVTILSAVAPQVSAAGMAAKWEEGGKILAQTMRNLEIAPDRVTTILREGDPKYAVCDVSEEIQADLIVMGSRGLNRLEAIFENSVSQFVFQLASRPMLSIRDDTYVKKIKRVMVAIDKFASTQYCLDLAFFLLREIPKGQLTLLYVDPARGRDPQVITGRDAEVNEMIAPAFTRAKRLGIDTRCFVTGGNEGKAICTLADERSIDLLVVGSPERRPTIARSLPDFDRLLGGSVSDYVRVNAICPVLLGRTFAQV
ncbi:MAG: universal stress protein [Cyanobacteria bacterium J06641_5]